MRRRIRDGWCHMIQGIVRALAVPLLMGGLGSSVLLASQVRLIDLDQMTQRAARIFSGRCTGTRVDFDAALGREVTVATFKVQRAIKGVKGGTVNVRVLGAAAAHGAPGDAPAGVPTFRAGDEVILFLYGESAQGLSASVGLGQGHFRVLTDKRGRRVALNDLGNRNLLSGLRPELRARLAARDDGSSQSQSPRQREALDAADLLDVVEALVAADP